MFSRLRSVILKDQAEDMVSQTRRTTTPNSCSLKFHHIVSSFFFSTHYSRIIRRKKSQIASLLADSVMSIALPGGCSHRALVTCSVSSHAQAQQQAELVFSIGELKTAAPPFLAFWVWSFWQLMLTRRALDFKSYVKRRRDVSWCACTEQKTHLRM